MVMPRQMVKDLLVVSGIPIEEIEAIRTALQEEGGFATRASLEQVVRDFIDDDRQVSAVVSALQNLFPQQLERMFATLREWRELDESNAKHLSQEALEAIEEKLPRLIRDYKALAKFRKARRLASILGNSMESVDLICDVRPVFNSDRDLVEGMFPLTTMKITYERQDEEMKVLEVQLSQEMLNELADKVQKAQQKLDILNKSSSEWIPGGLVDFD